MGDSRLAIDGGTPVVSEPLPTGVSGPSVIGDEEIEAVTEVLRSQELFRYPQGQERGCQVRVRGGRLPGRGVRADGQLRYQRSHQCTDRGGRRARRRGYRSRIHIYLHRRRGDGHRRGACNSGDRRVARTRSPGRREEDHSAYQGSRSGPHARRACAAGRHSCCRPQARA